MKKLFFLFFLSSFSVLAQNLPNGFVYLKEIDSTIVSDLKYFTQNNFVGKPIKGYHANKIILTEKAAFTLKKVQSQLIKRGLSLKVFDAYRPQQAVNHFEKWAKQLNDTVNKQEYYPNVYKKDLFKLDYIASRSGHSRGSTVDVTIVNIKTKVELDMGSKFDFFGKTSHPFYPNLTRKQKANRLLLRDIMLKNGFKPYHKEWWHFTLKNEPFPKNYFNFPIE